MIIFQSEIELDNSSCTIKTPFDIKGERQYLWYKLPIAYKDYLVTENLDAALIGLLVLAMINGEDIHIKGQISSKLNYTVNTYLIKALVLSDSKYKAIKVKADRLNNKSFIKAKSTATATGISCGIDSLATLAIHNNLDEDYKIKYLTYFKAGAHGIYGGSLSNQIFEKGLEKASSFAKENNYPLILIESNIMDVLKINFQSLHTLIQLSCVLNIQKLVSNYYYASSFRFDFYELKGFNSSWDILLLDYLETESINFYSSASQYTRLERTEVVTNYQPSYSYLDVCFDPLNAKALNCSKCEKCVRTMLSLELLGKIENYKYVFDLSIYKTEREKYIGGLLLNKNLNQTNQEIYFKLKKNNLIKFKHYVIAINTYVLSEFNRFKKNIKNKLK